MNLFLDFETRSKVELKSAGAYRYAQDPSTEALCASWALDHEPPQRWQRGDPMSFMLYAQHPDTTIVAHNAEFERLILKHHFHLDLPPSRFKCTAAQARRTGLPGGLDVVARALSLEHQKDTAAGKRLITKLSKPRRPSKANANADPFWEPETAPDDFDDMYAYNQGDVEAHRELFYLLPSLEDREQRLWELTVKMNDRGLQVDLDAVKHAQAVADEERGRLSERFEVLVGCPAGSPRGAAVLGLDSLDKVHVRHALRRTDLEPRVREALELRKRLAKTSVRKLSTLINQTCKDGRYRGGLLYSGAERTQRWSGRGVQMQNLPRGLGDKTELAFDSLGNGTFLMAYDDPLQTISEMLKGMFVGTFLIGDYAQIEARSLAWLSGQKDLVAAFAAGEDVYSGMASTIYGHPVTKQDFDEVLRIAKRQLGKIAVLGCGYGLGPAGLIRQMDEVFDVALDPETAWNVVNAYRTRYPRIPKFWRKLESLFCSTIDKRKFEHYARRWAEANLTVHNRFIGKTPVAWLTLPSGRPLCYYDVLLQEDHWPDGQSKSTPTYFGRNIYKGGKWERVSTYGGKLTENVIQALSREVMADAMLRLDDAGFHLGLTVHDEIVSEDPPAALPEFLHTMEEDPGHWAEGLPLAVEGFATERYRK